MATTALILLVSACTGEPGTSGPADTEGFGGDATVDPRTDADLDDRRDDLEELPGRDAAAEAAEDVENGDPLVADGSDASASYGCVDDELLGDSLWPPMATLSNADTLELEVVSEWTTVSGLVLLAVTELRYTSWQVRDCRLEPVRIEAFYAVPTRLEGGEPDPAIVVAHGLGGCGDAEGAARRAARLGVAAIYYTGPGNCGSTGRGNADPTALFDTIPDPRASWFWSHAVAGSRAITVLETFAETDSARLGMTGYSAGGLATLNVNGFDDRLVATVPVSGVGDLGSAAAAGGWENDLLEAADLTRGSPEFEVVLETVDPINQAPTQHGAVLLVNGAQDEFFPLDSTLATFEALGGEGHRLALIPNWDHGIYAIDVGGFGVCGAFDNSDLAARRVAAATRFWFGHHLTGDDRFAELPAIPTAELFEVSGFLGASATLSGGYAVVEAYLYGSLDNAYTFAGLRLEDRQGDTWSDIDSLIPWSTANPDVAVFFTELRLRVDPLGINDFWITSRPQLPAGFVPDIRPIDPTQCR